ncbi:MAG: hypothetical protein IKJ01_03900 [Lachnospiraceae bacterium]|nr:hypothetical protein [Lachnospiraceae bacterium]
MSQFARFMKQNKVALKNEKYAPTERITDETGKPMEWEFRHITSKENERIKDDCTKEVQVTGKPNLFRPKTDTAAYVAKLIVESTVFPDLYDAELQDSYGVNTPEDLLYELVDGAGEYQELTLWIQKFQGFGKSFDEKLEEAKN